MNIMDSLLSYLRKNDTRWYNKNDIEIHTT